MPEKIGRYEDLAVIGRGGMGMIYRARDPVLERSVALKVISSFEVTADLRARFFREARPCAQIAAAATTHGDLTRTGMMMGTPRYMAPEQVRGHADQRSDIFSVGAVAYELFSGRPPFAGDNPLQILEQLRTATPPRLSELDPSLPSELSDIVDRAIRKEPEERFADLGQMGRELEAVQRGLGEGPKQVPVAESAKRVAQTATVVSPTGAVAEPPSPRSEIDHAESTDRWPSGGVPTAWDTGETSVSRAPRLALATGVAIAAIVIAAVC